MSDGSLPLEIRRGFSAKTDAPEYLSWHLQSLHRFALALYAMHGELAGRARSCEDLRRIPDRVRCSYRLSEGENTVCTLPENASRP